MSQSAMLPEQGSSADFSHVKNIINYTNSASFQQENVTVRFVPMDKHQGLANLIVLLVACESFCTA
jgi:hypothetical protein